VNEKNSKAYSVLGVIKRNFIYMDKNTFSVLYKAMVRLHLEYANAVWCPYKKMTLKELKKFKKEQQQCGRWLRLIIATCLFCCFSCAVYRAV